MTYITWCTFQMTCTKTLQKHILTRKRPTVNLNLTWGVYVNNATYDIDSFAFALYYKDITLQLQRRVLLRIICNFAFFQNVLSILTPISSVHFKCNMEISQRTFKFLLKKNFDLKTMSTVLFVSKSVPRGPYKRM